MYEKDITQRINSENNCSLNRSDHLINSIDIDLNEEKKINLSESNTFKRCIVIPEPSPLLIDYQRILIDMKSIPEATVELKNFLVNHCNKFTLIDIGLTIRKEAIRSIIGSKTENRFLPIKSLIKGILDEINGCLCYFFVKEYRKLFLVSNLEIQKIACEAIEKSKYSSANFILIFETLRKFVGHNNQEKNLRKSLAKNLKKRATKLDETSCEDFLSYFKKIIKHERFKKTNIKISWSIFKTKIIPNIEESNHQKIFDFLDNTKSKGFLDEEDYIVLKKTLDKRKVCYKRMNKYSNK